MNRHSLLATGRYDPAWIRDFYEQTGIWWGANDDDDDGAARARLLGHFAAPPRRVLDLGTGPGATAAAMADAGYDVVAIDLSPLRLQYAYERAKRPRAGSLEFREADFYTVELAGRFDIVTCWDGFGLGTDADQRRLLRRVAAEWLAAGGLAFVDVFNPPRPIRDAGTEERLRALPGVAGSVDMVRRCHYDPVHARWIDEWVPQADPGAALAQAVRCYAPPDFALLLEGTGLALRDIVVGGDPVTWATDAVANGGPLLEAWSYLAVLAPG